MLGDPSGFRFDLPAFAITDDINLLSRAISHTGLTPTHFAHRILARDDRIIRRWLAGENLLPKKVSRWLWSTQYLPNLAWSRGHPGLICSSLLEMGGEAVALFSDEQVEWRKAQLAEVKQVLHRVEDYGRV